MIPALVLVSGCDRDQLGDGSAKVLGEQGPCQVPFEVEGAPASAWALPALQTCLPEYRLTMPPETLQMFEQDVYTPDQLATFITPDGQSLTAEVRLRGQSARHFPKQSWNVDLNDGRFEKRRRLNLVAEYQDQTLLTEKLGYDVLRGMGVPAPRTKFVRLYVNDEYQGVYLDIEQVDKHFTSARGFFPDEDPTIYRCPRKDCEMKTWRVPYQGQWEKKTNEDEPINDVLDLMAVMNHTPEPDFERALDDRFNLELFLRSMATDVLISNNYVEDSQSYMIHDRVNDRWTYVPWDLNNNDARFWPTYGLDSTPFSDHDLFTFTLTDQNTEYIYNRRSQDMCGTEPCYPGYLPVFSNLGTRIVMNPQLRGRLIALIRRGQQELFETSAIHERIDKMYKLLSPHVLGEDSDHLDRHMNPVMFQMGPDYLKRFVTERNAFVARELSAIEQQVPVLILTQVNAAEGWVEVKNQGSTAIDLGGKTLTNNLRQALGQNLAPYLLRPGATLRLAATALGVPLEANGEVGLFDGQSIVGMHDVLFYGQLTAGQHYARDAGGHWQVVTP
ncbi:MAG: CotH kinase family protein [Myxococcota bacterium]|nr:CotH kinase family protein [Myxococcota bacterium]